MFRSLPRLAGTSVPALAVVGAAAAYHHGKSAVAEPQRESYSWGSTTFGETGHGHELIGGVGLPAPIDALRASGKRVRTLVSSGTSCMSAALTEEGDVFSWGCGQNGRLGHGDSNANSPAPRHIEGLPDNVAQVAVGEFHGLALTATGQVYSWGTRGIGHDNKPKGKPALVPGLAGVRIVHITAGREHSVAVDDRGAAYAWGAGSSYALGHGDKAEQKRPLQIMALAGKRVAFAAAGREHTLFLLEDGSVWAVGTDSYGQCGQGLATPYVKAPQRVPLPAGKKAVMVYAGEYTSLALCEDHSVFAWGSNKQGTLGHGDTTDLGSPRLLEAPLKGKVVEIAAGGGHTLLLTDANVLYATGRGRSGQLGRGDALESVAAYRTSPVEVHGLSERGPIVSIAAGRDHSLALVERLA